MLTAKLDTHLNTFRLDLGFSAEDNCHLALQSKSPACVGAQVRAEESSTTMQKYTNFGEGCNTPGTDLVETVPMPEPVRMAVAAFVAEHHVEQVFFKRKRDSANPQSPARRAPIREDEQ